MGEARCEFCGRLVESRVCQAAKRTARSKYIAACDTVMAGCDDEVEALSTNSRILYKDGKAFPPAGAADGKRESRAFMAARDQQVRPGWRQ